MSPLRTAAPWALLPLTCALILAVTAALARREETVRVERDRAGLRQFAAELQGELQRLERNYEGHAARLAREILPADRVAAWQLCERVVGVQQYSLIHRASEWTLDQHISITVTPLRQPTFAPAPSSSRGESRLLSEDELLRGEETSGWVDEPGQPLLYWQRRAPDQCAVLQVDAHLVAEAIDQWLRPLLESRFAPLRAAGGPDRLTGPGDTVLAVAGTLPAAPPDLLLSLRTRFGTWQLASWDPRVTRTVWRRDVLAGGLVAALLLPAAAFLLLQHQLRALRLARQRVSFVSAVSHELRAPITNILLNLELVAEDLDPSSPEGERLGYVREEAQRLSRIIENVLTFSRGPDAARRPSLRRCVPAELVRAAVEGFRPAFARRGLSLSVEIAEEAEGMLEADAFSQIVTNLLSNVEKHVPAGGAVVTLSHPGAGLELRVRDTGPGIPAARAEEIFAPFTRLNRRLDAPGSGAGLGLTISRQLAAAMGGTLELEPIASGTCFVLRLPFARTATLQPVA